VKQRKNKDAVPDEQTVRDSIFIFVSDSAYKSETTVYEGFVDGCF